MNDQTDKNGLKVQESEFRLGRVILENDVYGKYPRPLWISFAGKDKSFVIKLIQGLKSFKEDEKLKIDPKAYLQVSSNETIKQNKEKYPEIKYHLGLSDSIHDLVDLIASCPRRLFVISPNYVNSQNCLMELACSLINNQNLKLAIILLKTDAGVFTDKLKVIINLSNSDGHKEVLELHEPLHVILAEIYNKKLKSTMPKTFHLNEEENVSEFFKNKLVSHESKIYIQAKSYRKSILEDLVNYVETLDDEVNKILLKDSAEFTKSAFKQWQDSLYAKKLSREDGKDWDFLENLHVNEIAEFVGDFEGKEFSNENKEGLKKLAVFIAVSLIDPVWAADMRRSSPGGLRLWMSSSEEEHPTIAVDFGYKIAAQVIHKELPDLTLKSDGHVDLNNTFQIKSIPLGREQDQHFNELFAEFVMRVLPGLFSDHLALTNNMTKNPKNFAYKLVSRLSSRGHLNNKNETRKIRLIAYSGDDGFYGKLDQHWESVANKFVDVINYGIENGRRVKVGLIFVSHRNDGNSVRFLEMGPYTGSLYDLLIRILKMAEN